MSGLEIGALVAGVIGAGASAISARQDTKKSRSYKETTTSWKVGNPKRPSWPSFKFVDYASHRAAPPSLSRNGSALLGAMELR